MKKILDPMLQLIGIIIKRYNISITQGNHKIKFPKIMTNLELGKQILGTYEKDERKLTEKYLNANDSVLEMGACIGVVSLTINDILYDKSKQVSVEPNPEMLEYLRTNRELNSAKFQIETCIVSKSKEVDFFLGGEAFLGSSLLSGKNKIIVRCKSLEELNKEYFDFSVIVMDIEGGELEFFRSFNLENSKIRLIIWETHCKPNLLAKSELQECYQILESYSFKFVERVGNVEAWLKKV